MTWWPAIDVHKDMVKVGAPGAGREAVGPGRPMCLNLCMFHGVL